MNSCLYECQILHARFGPKSHRFLYRIFLFAIDLDELGSLHRRLRWFSWNRPNFFSFRDNDFFPTDEPVHNGENRGPGASSLNLKTRILKFLADRGQPLPNGRVMLVTLPRVLGYLFNPVSFYFCFDEAGSPVAALAEVTNTFKEIKPYFLGATTRRDQDGETVFRMRTPKHFYVSPFSEVDLAFDFCLPVPAERLAIQIDDYDGAQRTLTSSLMGRRQLLNDRRLAWYLIKYPFLTLRIITLIHWQAFLLWLKKNPWFSKSGRAADQRDLYRPHSSIVHPPKA